MRSPLLFIVAPPFPPQVYLSRPHKSRRFRAPRLCLENQSLKKQSPGGLFEAAIDPPLTSPASAPVSISTQALPSFHIIEPPHLKDYISSLEHRESPLLESRAKKTFTAAGDVVLNDISFDVSDEKLLKRAFRAYLKAGPRQRVYYGNGVRAAIVSCGGICPGINSVIRELTLCLFQYKADKVFGVHYGYRGFYQGNWTELSAEVVENIHKQGGSILGSSRGGFDLIRIVDAIETRKIDQVYVIGGDGTIMGCTKIYHEIRRRGLKIAVVSVPKTIDNDIAIIDRSFGTCPLLLHYVLRFIWRSPDIARPWPECFVPWIGFETAVDEAQRAINAAYVEAHSFPDCVGIVKLSTYGINTVLATDDEGFSN